MMNALGETSLYIDTMGTSRLITLSCSSARQFQARAPTQRLYLYSMDQPNDQTLGGFSAIIGADLCDVVAFLRGQMQLLKLSSADASCIDSLFSDFQAALATMDQLDIVARFRMCCAADTSVAHGFVRSGAKSSDAHRCALLAWELVLSRMASFVASVAAAQRPKSEALPYIMQADREIERELLDAKTRLRRQRSTSHAQTHRQDARLHPTF